MEHRWGERAKVSVPVRVMAHSFAVRHGKLTNLSVSGAFINTDAELRLLTRIQVSLDLPVRARYEAPIIWAYVARKSADGVGIEWCDFAPRAVTELLRSVAKRRYPRSRVPDTPVVTTQPELVEPLLRHGT